MLPLIASVGLVYSVSATNSSLAPSVEPTHSPSRQPTLYPTISNAPTFESVIKFADTNELRISPSDAVGLDYFGESISVHKDIAVVGACGQTTDQGDLSGAVYVYNRNGTDFISSQKIIPEVLVVNECKNEDNCKEKYYSVEEGMFGNSVSVWGDKLLVGAYKSNSKYELEGAAYLYSLADGAFTVVQKLYPPFGQEYMYFGVSVAMAEKYCLVGASGNDDNG